MSVETFIYHHYDLTWDGAKGIDGNQILVTEELLSSLCVLIIMPLSIYDTGHNRPSLPVLFHLLVRSENDYPFKCFVP